MFVRSSRSLLAALSFALLAGVSHAQAPAPARPAQPVQEESLFGSEPTTPSGPTRRLPDGHPDFTGYWKGIREPGKPGGNLGKDQPNFELPFTPEGKAAQIFNRTKTIDPEALCILGGIPRHNGSALPFEILHTPKRLAFLYLYNTHRLIPIDGRSHDEDPDPKYFGNCHRRMGRRHAGDRFHRLQGQQGRQDLVGREWRSAERPRLMSSSAGPSRMPIMSISR